MPVKGAKKICGAKKRGKDETCQNPAMPNGRCRLHGGKSLKGAMQPAFKTGRYSKSLPTRLAARYEELAADPELLNIRDEILVLRARLSDLLSKVDTGESEASWERVQL